MERNPKPKLQHLLLQLVLAWIILHNVVPDLKLINAFFSDKRKLKLANTYIPVIFNYQLV